MVIIVIRSHFNVTILVCLTLIHRKSHHAAHAYIVRVVWYC